MKALIQRVMNASVLVSGEVVTSIDQGLCVLVGICNTDTHKDVEFIVRKILNTKLFDNIEGKRWGNSVMEKELEILCVSQFTLYNTLKGNKPDFHHAMSAEKSKQFYEEFLEVLRKSYKPEKIKDGVFGAYMQVCIQNDGPVTIQIESPKSSPIKEVKSYFGILMLNAIMINIFTLWGVRGQAHITERVSYHCTWCILPFTDEAMEID